MMTVMVPVTVTPGRDGVDAPPAGRAAAHRTGTAQGIMTHTVFPPSSVGVT